MDTNARNHKDNDPFGFAWLIHDYNLHDVLAGLLAGVFDFLIDLRFEASFIIR